MRDDEVNQSLKDAYPRLEWELITSPGQKRAVWEWAQSGFKNAYFSTGPLRNVAQTLRLESPEALQDMMQVEPTDMISAGAWQALGEQDLEMQKTLALLTPDSAQVITALLVNPSLAIQHPELTLRSRYELGVVLRRLRQQLSPNASGSAPAQTPRLNDLQREVVGVLQVLRAQGTAELQGRIDAPLNAVTANETGPSDTKTKVPQEIKPVKAINAYALRGVEPPPGAAALKSAAVTLVTQIDAAEKRAGNTSPKTKISLRPPEAMVLVIYRKHAEFDERGELLPDALARFQTELAPLSRYLGIRNDADRDTLVKRALKELMSKQPKDERRSSTPSEAMQYLNPLIPTSAETSR